MAALPLFFHGDSLIVNKETPLNEDTARHIGQVLRMRAGDALQLTDGKGNLADAVITQSDKKKCSVTIHKLTHQELPAAALHLAIAFTKNTSRNEWLLEKATELGVRSIIPLQATRTERERIKHERWNNILVSAMMQSQQYHLPVLTEAHTLSDALKHFNTVPQKLVAHCITEHKRTPIATAMKPATETLILIGPEGDFTQEEIHLCEREGCIGISIGNQRLRTETAAMAVCAYFNMINTG